MHLNYVHEALYYKCEIVGPRVGIIWSYGESVLYYIKKNSYVLQDTFEKNQMHCYDDHETFYQNCEIRDPCIGGQALW